MRTSRWVLAIFLAAVAGVGTAYAFPKFLLYQGRYLSNGTPTNGNVSMEFRVTRNAVAVACGAGVGGDLFWTSGSTAVATSNGLFSYKLGYLTDGVTQDPTFVNLNWTLPNTTYYIDVCVAGTQLSPKEQIGSTAYSFFASSAGFVAVSGLDGSSVTLQGNTFNAAEKLVRLDASNRLPAVDGSLLTNLSSASLNGAALLSSTQTFAGSNTFANSVGITGFVTIASSVTISSHATVTGTLNRNANLSVGGAGFGVTFASAVTAGWFYGDGSALTGVTSVAADPTKVAKTGDGMSGQLTVGSTLTVVGSAFSVGGSTVSVSEGNVGIRTASPAAVLDVNGSARFGASGKSLFTSAGSLELVSGSTITSNGTLSISTAASAAATGVPAIVVLSSGAVGVGTISPNSKLDVSGEIQATVFNIGAESQSATCGHPCTATATCTAGKKVVYGGRATASVDCNTNPAVCSAYCTVGSASCSATSTAGGASVFVVCAKIQ